MKLSTDLPSLSPLPENSKPFVAYLAKMKMSFFLSVVFYGFIFCFRAKCLPAVVLPIQCLQRIVWAPLRNTWTRNIPRGGNLPPLSRFPHFQFALLPLSSKTLGPYSCVPPGEIFYIRFLVTQENTAMRTITANVVVITKSLFRWIAPEGVLVFMWNFQRLELETPIFSKEYIK